MSAGAGSEQDVELNLAPIIDCFTVLITYLLVSASFISLTVLNVGVSASGTAAPAPPAGTPPLSLSLKLAATKNFKLKLTGGPKRLDQSFDVASDDLLDRARALKQTYPDLNDISVSADPTVQYKDVVKTVESLRQVIPKIYLTKG
jgi:biopolymer transport protein ExbD